MSYNDEADTWDAGDETASYYAEFLEESKQTPFGKTGPPSGADEMTKVLTPEDRPWEDTPQGKIKHVLNEKLCEDLDVPIRGTDMYMQEIPPNETSGRHRHMSEEVLYVLEGKGYDLHWDTDITPTEDGQEMEWTVEDEPKRFEWERGDVVYIPTGSVHQHFNASEDEPARFMSISNRAYNFLGYGYNDLEQYESVDY
jgi:quercetin dioxygenase-like cupin family protein